MIRKPAVAGQFYPATPQKLKDLIKSLTPDPKKIVKEKAIACVLPHAGYIYSGKVAATTLSGIDFPQECIILGPNHYGEGKPCSLMREGEWQTPLGDIKINTPLADALLENSAYLCDDPIAHAQEHAIEVELPLIQEIARRDFTFVPITLAWADELVYKDISEAIAKSIRSLKKDVLIIASSDMTHYEQQLSANRKDEEAIKAILKLDERELLEKIDRLNISMCGSLPTVIAMRAAKKLGARRALLTAYQTSGDVTQDYTCVVGYAGFVIQ
jgi:AmmeMemoRadiSam system protein B